MPVALGRASQLTSLDLSNNLLTGLGPAQFNSVPGLRALNLSGCGLAHIAPAALGNLSGLAKLDISRQESEILNISQHGLSTSNSSGVDC